MKVFEFTGFGKREEATVRKYLDRGVPFLIIFIPPNPQPKEQCNHDPNQNQE